MHAAGRSPAGQLILALEEFSQDQAATGARFLGSLRPGLGRSIPCKLELAKCGRTVPEVKAAVSPRLLLEEHRVFEFSEFAWCYGDPRPSESQLPFCAQAGPVTVTGVAGFESVPHRAASCPCPVHLILHRRCTETMGVSHLGIAFPGSAFPTSGRQLTSDPPAPLQTPMPQCHPHRRVSQGLQHRGQQLSDSWRRETAGERADTMY